MTDRKQALQDLRDKVAAGVNYETMGHTRLCQKAFPKLDDFDGSREAYSNSAAQQAILAWRNGSLDAAKALHDAVLPNWDIQIGTCEDNNFEASVAYPLRVKTYDGTASSLARAWILAILSALIAQQTETAKEQDT